jgi:hypothetical protein
MTIRVKCTTSFDITETGVRNRSYRADQPFNDRRGQTIKTVTEWQQARNQQSNWETVNQVISLRTLPEKISSPVADAISTTWSFEFDVVDPSAIFYNSDPVGYLKADCAGVPMITGLKETGSMLPFLTTDGEFANIWFDVVQNIDHK